MDFANTLIFSFNGLVPYVSRSA